MNFSSKLKSVRELCKLSQKEVAEKIFISQQAYAKYETGASSPNPETLKKIADLFNVSVDYLLGRTSKGSHSPNFSKRELELIQKYRDNPKMQPAVNTLLGITAEEPEDVYEIPVAARSGKNGLAMSSFSEEERRAALESEFPGVFEETE